MGELKGTKYNKSIRADAGPAIQPPEQTPGKATGVPLVDAVKTDGDRPGAFLTPDERAMARLALSNAVHVSAANQHAAIQNERLELLTTLESPTLWTGFAELLYLGGTTGLIGLLGRSFEKFQSSVVHGLDIPSKLVVPILKLKKEQVTAVAVTASKSLRTSLKNAAKGPTAASAENEQAADFVRTLQDAIGPMTIDLTNRVPVALSDAGLIAMVHSYEDQEFHSVAAYQAEIKDLITRFKAQKIASIGVSKSNGIDAFATKQVAHVIGPDNRSAYALVEFYDPKYAKSHKWVNGDLVPGERTEFVSWIDDDMIATARSTQEARFGGIPGLDAQVPTSIPEIDKWRDQ